MSKENLEQFMNQVAESEELQAKIGEEIDAESLMVLGAECGCEFTVEDLQESGELSDEELAEVAGGIKQPERQGDLSGKNTQKVNGIEAGDKVVIGGGVYSVEAEVDDNGEDATNTPPEQLPKCYECPCTLIAERGAV